MSTTRAWLRRSVAMAVAAAAVLTLPAAAQALTTFGSRLNNDPANAGECAALATPCTLVSYIHPTDPDGDPYAGGAPVGGVITTFRIRAFGEGGAAATVTFRLADISRPDPNDQGVAVATDAGTGPTVEIPANNDPETPIRSFAARLPVQQGDHLAIDGTNVWATYNTSGDQFSYRFDPPLVQGQGPRGSSMATGELLVQADIEPDADGDGFGDETQDGCPSQATTQGACDPGGGPGGDTTPPDAGGFAVSGSRFFFTLSEAATATLRLEKRKTGRKVRGKCRARTRKNRRRPRCKRYVALGSQVTHDGSAGANTVDLKRVRGRRLGAGRYRLTILLRDAAGNENTLRHTFRVR